MELHSPRGLDTTPQFSLLSALDVIGLEPTSGLCTDAIVLQFVMLSLFVVWENNHDGLSLLVSGSHGFILFLAMSLLLAAVSMA